MKIKNNSLHQIVKIGLGSALVVFLITASGCDKALDSIVDCTGESLLTALHYETDETNSRQINYEIQYAGEFTVASITWNFGDGNTQTVTSLNVEHTYAAAGTYEVKANVKLKKGKRTCQNKQERSVTVD